VPHELARKGAAYAGVGDAKAREREGDEHSEGEPDEEEG
jgi:hypothetical protein